MTARLPPTVRKSYGDRVEAEPPRQETLHNMDGLDDMGDGLSHSDHIELRDALSR